MTNLGHSVPDVTTGPPAGAAGSAAPAAKERRRWLVPAVMVLCLLVVVLDNTVLNVALPRIQQELGASQSQQEWIVDACTLVFAALLLPYGVLADRLGRRRVLFAGMAVFGASSFAAAFATSLAGASFATNLMDRYQVYAITASVVLLAGWLIHTARTSGIHLASIRRHARRLARHLMVMASRSASHSARPS